MLHKEDRKMNIFKKKNTNYFFEQFLVVGEFSLQAFDVLKQGLENFDSTKSLDLKNAVHQIEHKADEIKHETEERLAREFMTPIDREDIFTLLNNIDDLTDAIDEISYKIYIRAYKSMPKNINQFIQKANEAIVAVIDLLKHLSDFNNKKVLDPYIEKVMQIEEQTDYLYEENVHYLYQDVEKVDYRQLVLIEKIYSMFEMTTDKCRDIARTIKTIMYKNI